MANEQIWASTLQKSNLWIKELSADLGFGWEDTLLALRTVMHGLRDRLPSVEAAHVAGQFPLLIKGVYFDGWKPGGTPVRVRTKEEFYALVAPQLQRGIRNVDVEQVTRTVLGFLASHMSEGELEQIRGVIPEGLRDLWPEKSTSAAHG